MDLRIKDFTLVNYTKALDQARQHYSFISFENALDEPDCSIIWRHDIDMSVSQALQMARIETDRNVFSTFLVQLTSKFYNVFEHETRDGILAIKELGHQIGLHFDPTFYQILDHKMFKEKLQFEKKILEELLKIEIKVFSLHQPTAVGFKTDKLMYEGMINVYHQFFQTQYRYCSDSNGYWRFDRLFDILETKPAKLHILTHPVWWTEDALRPLDRLKQCIDKRAKHCEECYREDLRKFNRKG